MGEIQKSGYDRAQNMENKERTHAIIEHVKKNRIATNKRRRKCVDGGYKKDQAPGAVARAGGDLGYSEALLLIKNTRPELGLTVQETFSFVNDFVRSRGEKYGWHSDTHAHGPNEIIGCGHCLRAFQYAQEFGVNAEDVRELVEIIESAGDTDKIILDRKHDEKAVLVITSSETTVHAWDTEQYFIYNAVNDSAFLKEFVPYLNKRLGKRGNISQKELQEALDHQLDVTLRMLAGNRPLYEVNPDDRENPQVHFKKVIPPFQAS